jgi:hypothetical protein
MMIFNTILLLMLLVGAIANDRTLEITTRIGKCKEVGTPTLGLVNEKCLMTGQILFFIPSTDASDSVRFASVVDLSVDCDKYGWLFGKKEPVPCMLVKDNNETTIHKWLQPEQSIGDSAVNGLMGLFYNIGFSPEWIYLFTYWMLITLPHNMYETAWQHIDWMLGALLILFVVCFYKFRPTYKGIPALRQMDEPTNQIPHQTHSNHVEMPAALEWDENGKPIQIKKDT